MRITILFLLDFAPVVSWLKVKVLTIDNVSLVEEL